MSQDEKRLLCWEPVSLVQQLNCGFRGGKVDVIATLVTLKSETISQGVTYSGAPGQIRKGTRSGSEKRSPGSLKSMTKLPGSG